MVLSVPHPVTEHTTAPRDTFLEVFLNTPFLVLADGSAFFLGIGCKYGQHQFAVSAYSVNVLLLKINIHPQRFEHTDSLKERHSISRKAGDGFCEYQINFSVTAIFQHLLKAGSRFFRAGDSFI